MTHEEEYRQRMLELNHGLNAADVCRLFTNISSKEFRDNLPNIQAFLTQNEFFSDEMYALLPEIQRCPHELRGELYYILLLLLRTSEFNKELFDEALELVIQEFFEDKFCEHFLSVLGYLVSGSLDAAERLCKVVDLLELIEKNVASGSCALQLSLLQLCCNLENQEVVMPGRFLEQAFEAFTSGDALVRAGVLNYAAACCGDSTSRRFVLDRLAPLNAALVVKSITLWSAFLTTLEAIVAGVSGNSTYSANGTDANSEILYLQEQLYVLDEMQIIEDALLFEDAIVQFRALFTLKRIAVEMPDIMLEEQYIVERVYQLAHSANPGVWTQALEVMAIICTNQRLLMGIEVLEAKNDVTNPELLSSVVVFLESEFVLDEGLKEIFVEGHAQLLSNLRDAVSSRTVYNFLFKYSLIEFDDDDLLVL